jgi:aspartokinase
MTKEELTKLLMESYERGQSDMIKACHETISIAIDTAIFAEREACAKMCDYVYDNIVTDEHIKDMAFKIRARGQS